MEVRLIKRDGKVIMDKPFDFLCSTLRNGEYTLSIKRHTKPRTLNQNSLFWLWLTCLEQETGTDKQDWHDYYCNKFLRRVAYVKDQQITIAGGTSGLNTLQMTDFMNKVQADAASEWGITLPLPQDRYYQQFIDYYRDR